MLPRVHEAVNEEWISDKTRYAIDGLVRRRLDRPYIGRERKREVEWREALELVAERLKKVPGERIAAIAGDLCDAEAMFALKEFLTGLGATSLDCRQDGAKLDPRCRAGYLFNTTIAGIENADACLLVGTNPRWEAPLVNARLRKRYLQGGFRVAAIGPALDLTFPVEMLGDGGACLNALAARRTPLGRGAARCQEPDDRRRAGGARPPGRRPRSGRGQAHRRKLAGWFARIGTGSMCCTAPRRGSAASISALCREPGGRDVSGILAGCKSGDIEILYLLGADEIDTSDLGSAFVIYQGHHGDRGAASRRCRPAGRRLHREGRHLRQHRGSRAAGAPRGVPARRGARGLEDPARAVRRDRPSAALRCAARAAPPDVGERIRYWPNRIW